MESTQRLECTQDLYGTQSERKSPDQIGFLGICGTKYPVKHGPNKIGREPQTCQIVLNVNTVSRLHAVLSILNSNVYMLMDMDSPNKTRIGSKTLKPYISYPLKNGDTVQFGDVIGVFRLLEEESDLPMTQVLGIPSTPDFPRQISRVNKAAVITVPESPDVSDHDDSFIMPSQTKGTNFKSPGNKYMKFSGKTVAIQPIGSNKIDNVFWNSSKKSTSLHLDDSNSSLDDFSVSVKPNATAANKSNDVHEMETQAPFPNTHNESTDSIYTANTQVPTECHASLSIHSMDTQLPEPATDRLPNICTIEDQQEMQFDLCTANKENDIFNAQTQLIVENKNVRQSVNKNPDDIFSADTQLQSGEISIDAKKQDDSIFDAETQHLEEARKVSVGSNNSSSKTKSHEDILFDDIDDQAFEDPFDSQPLLPPVLSPSEDIEINLSQREIGTKQKKESPLKRTIRQKSDSSTDGEDINILLTQKIPEIKANDDDVTDCEEDLFENEPSNNECGEPIKSPTLEPKVNFEDMSTQIIEEDITIPPKIVNVPADKSVKRETGFEDLPTQVLSEDINHKESTGFEDLPTQVLSEDTNHKESNFDDLPTQVLEDVLDNVNCSEKDSTQQNLSEIISPFKVPFQTALKTKRKDLNKSNDSKLLTAKAPELILSPNNDEDNDKYYAATQEILDDLCTQGEQSLNTNVKLENEQSPKKKYIVADKSSGSSDGEERVNKFVASLTSTQIRDVVGVDSQQGKLKKMPSDPSDVEVTPKKVRPFRLMETELPNSQEIKITVSQNSKLLVTESSSESEAEEDSQEGTPILFHNKKRTRERQVKMNLTNKFDTKALPSRVITRLRKPSSKIQNSDDETKKISKNILKPKFLTEQDYDIDKDILDENISRLKTKGDKKTNKSAMNDSAKCAQSKKEIVSPEEDDVKVLDEKLKNKTKGKAKQYITVVEPDKKNGTTVIAETKKDLKKDTMIPEIDKDKQKSKQSVRNKSKTNKKSSKVKESADKTRDLILSTSNSIASETLDSTDVTNKTARSTRSSRNKTKNESKNEEKTASPEKDVSKRKRGRPRKVPQKEEKKNVSSPEHKVEIRRSKRSETRSKKNEVQNVIINKSRHEQSTVYNISSDSSAESPKSLKRAAEDLDYNIDGPVPKRTRSGAASVAAATTTSATVAAPTQRVLFTAFPCDPIKSQLEALGAVVVSDVHECSVLVTREVRRTLKLLCAVGLGLPVVGPAWVQACADARTLLDPWQHLLRDEAAERRFRFSLERTLRGKRNFLRGYNVSGTPNVLPTAPEMKQIVECSGGTWQAQKPQWLCVSCPADRALWPDLRRRGATIVSSELILSGVLRQKIEIDAFRLDR